MLKIHTFIIGLVILASFSVCSLTTEQVLEKGVLQIQPSALNSLRNYFDVLVVLVQKGKDNTTESEFLNVVNAVNQTEVIGYNSKLFGVLNVEDDVQEALKEYKFPEGRSVQIITKKKVFSYQAAQLSGLTAFYLKSLYNPIKTSTLETAQPNTLIFGVVTQEDEKKAQRLYNQFENTLQDRKLDAVMVKSQTTPFIKFKQLDGTIINYQSDPDDRSSVQEFFLVESLPICPQIDDTNYHVVFGSPIDVQVLLIYNQTLPAQKIQTLKQTLQQVAVFNRKEQLRYQRLIFASASMHYAKQLFGDMLEDMSGEEYRVLITRTDYTSFQLERYLFNKEQFTVDTLKEFIEDYRMKRLVPFYRSQKRPEPRPHQLIHKVVGKTFEQFVYHSGGSVLLLFIDSRSPESYKEWLHQLKEFVKKYKSFLDEKLKVGVFDLAKNQHQRLHLDFAPQIVLFEKTNKKRARSFRGELNQDTLRDWLNFWVKPLEIPQNYGKKPLQLDL